MIVFGTKSKALATEVLQEKCPVCGTQNNIEMHLSVKYAYLFWIPVFPLGKHAVGQCQHCQQVFSPKDMSPSLRQAYHVLSGKTKTPVWIYSGAAIIGVLMLFGVYAEVQKSKNSAVYIKHLLPNDILEIKTKEDHYTYLKVQDVKGDSIYLRENKEEVIIESAVDKLGTSESSFNTEVYMVPKSSLDKKYEDGTIVQVVRKSK